uniref:non-specific serine/threonine protein kinase n=1 Tax=Plectus sambesii TaxID=2011161 RepID=A0A914V6N4_9BILA
MASLGGDSATSTEDGRMRYRLEKVGYYSIGKTIGRGNFADVKLARHEISKCKVAIKIVDRTKVDTDNLAKIDREIRILKSLQHPHIIKLFQILKSDRYLYIVTEYAGGGELFELLVEKGKMSEIEGRRLFQQATSAVAYCHSMGVVHRDLKAENLLLDRHDNVKLIDFGFSNFQSPNQLLATWCGSPPYAAPELFIGREYDGTKADIWSLGVVLYILVSGGFPFPGSSMDKLKRAVLSGQVKIPYWVSVECADLIRKMLVVNPAKRYSVQQVVQHRWFTANMTNKVETLIEESLNPPTPTDVQPVAPLNGTVMLFLQQHTGWSDDRVTQAIIEKDFESSLYATYNMLCYKLARHYKDNHIATGHDTSRRGSRGSILSGKANVDIPDQAPVIPAHDLAKLNLSTSPELDSEDGDSSNSDAAEDLPRTSRISMRLLRAQYNSLAAAAATAGAQNSQHQQQQLQQQQSAPDRCARQPPLPPDALAYLQSTARPRGSLDAQAMAGAAMLRRQGHLPSSAGLDPAAALLAMPTYLMNDVPGVQPSPEMSQLPQVGLTPMWPYQPPVMSFYQTPS